MSLLTFLKYLLSHLRPTGIPLEQMVVGLPRSCLPSLERFRYAILPMGVVRIWKGILEELKPPLRNLKESTVHGRCLGKVATIAVMKHRSSLGRKGSSGLHVLNHSPLWEVRAGTQTRQKSRGRSWRRGHGQVLLTNHGLLPVESPLAQGWPHTPWAGSSPTNHQLSQLRDMPYRLAYSLMIWRYFLS